MGNAMRCRAVGVAQDELQAEVAALVEPWRPSPWRRLSAALADLFYPPSCAACRRFIEDTPAPPFCASCFARIGAGRQLCCLRCGYLLPELHQRPRHGCSWCRDRSLAFEACVTAAAYDEPLRSLILRFKQVEGAYLARALAWLLAQARGALLVRWHVEVIVPVPRHWWRRVRTGYNHAAALAVELNRLLGLEALVARTAVYRRRATRLHRGLSSRHRAANVAGAFALRRPSLLRDRRVLLLDDVLTSGATLSELARVVRRARPRALFAAAVARALVG